jgi:plasmid stability protein
MPWGQPFAAAIRATVAHRRGQRDEANALLTAASERFERGNMMLYANAARRRLGEILADDRGRQLIANSDEWMTMQRIKSPERMTRMLLPGF